MNRFAVARGVCFGLSGDELVACASGGHVTLLTPTSARRCLSCTPAAMPAAAALCELHGLLALLLPGEESDDGDAWDAASEDADDGDAWDAASEALATGMLRSATLHADPLVPFAPLPRSTAAGLLSAPAATMPAPLTGQVALAAAACMYATDTFAVRVPPTPHGACTAHGLAWERVPGPPVALQQLKVCGRCTGGGGGESSRVCAPPRQPDVGVAPYARAATGGRGPHVRPSAPFNSSQPPRRPLQLITAAQAPPSTHHSRPTVRLATSHDPCDSDRAPTHPEGMRGD
jgi:hypothetical protein